MEKETRQQEQTININTCHIIYIFVLSREYSFVLRYEMIKGLQGLTLAERRK
jgi:hypothetical protein